MTASWIKINQKLSEGIKLINGVEITKLSLLLKRIVENNYDNIFTEEEMTKLGNSLSLDYTDLTLLLQSMKYIFQESCKFVIKPTVLEEQLEQFNIKHEAAEIFVKYWTFNTKDILNNLQPKTSGLPSLLEDVKWELNLQISSEARQKQKTPKALIQLAICEDNYLKQDLVNIEMNHEQLLTFYNELEDIQSNLDNLKK